MPPLLFEEPKGGPLANKLTKHRQKSNRDRALITLKVATFAVAALLVGGVVLVVSSGGEDDPGRSSPPVPTIESSDTASPTTPTTVPTSPTPPVAVGNSATAQVTVTTTPPSLPVPDPGTQGPTGPTDEPGNGFAVIGEPCPQAGSYGITEDYYPVVCTGQPLTWHEIR